MRTREEILAEYACKECSGSGRSQGKDCWRCYGKRLDVAALCARLVLVERTLDALPRILIENTLKEVDRQFDARIPRSAQCIDYAALTGAAVAQAQREAGEP